MRKKDLTQRDGFKNRWGFILACIGSAVGMGNIWRFPVMVSLYGGLTYLIPYFLFVILIGCSGVMEKMSLGHRAQSGPVGTFGKCTEERWGNRTPGKAHWQMVSPPWKNPLLCFGCYCPSRRRLLWRYRLISV